LLSKDIILKGYLKKMFSARLLVKNRQGLNKLNELDLVYEIDLFTKTKVRIIRFLDKVVSGLRR
jgi:hypothetical protein